MIGPWLPAFAAHCRSANGPLLADTLGDYAARTTLIAMLYQSSHEAAASCQDHVAIVAALEQGDRARAEALMAEHLANVQAALRLPALSDPLDQLRSALAPLPQPARESADPPAAYLGALL